MRILVLLSLLPFAAAAQSEWSSFPSSPPAAVDAGIPAPPPTPAPAVAPKAATPDVAPAPSRDNFDPDAKRRVEERLRAAEAGKAVPQNSPVPGGKPAAAGAAASTDDAPVVGRKEEFLAGTEPHSPSTIGAAYNAPQNARVTVGGASIGLLHNVSSARLGPKGVLRFAFLGEYMNLGDFPVRNAGDVRTAGTFAVSFQPFEWGEAFLAYGATANSSSRTSPNLIQALGDLTVGVKVSRQWVKGLWAGLDLRLLTYSGVGNQSLDRFAVGFQPRAVVAYDLRAVAPKVPLIGHLNLGAQIDNTGALLQTTRPNASEEFALGINRYQRFSLGVGLEVPLPYVAPFVEYSLAAPLGTPAGGLVGPDGKAVDPSAAMANRLGLGLKVTAVKDLTLTLGVDLGLSSQVGLGIPATPPWNFLFAASFNIDPFQRGETKLVETIRERKVEQKADAKPTRVEGTVVDARTRKPVSGVIVAMVGAGLPPVASDVDTGRFLTHDLKGATVKLKASKDGYKEIEQELKLEAGKTAQVELALEAEEKKAAFELTVASKKKPVTATVAFVGTANQSAATSEANKDPVRVEVLAGTYTVNVTSEGYLSQTKEVQISAGGSMPLTFDLTPAPKKSLVVFKDDKIEILQQVHFETGKATILGDSFALLQQVVDAVIRNNVKRLRVEGHTDNRGDKAFNQKLSEDRARSVADFLIGQGIEKGRIDSAGYGDAKPVAPNLTARGRELNRRVEFLVLER